MMTSKVTDTETVAGPSKTMRDTRRWEILVADVVRCGLVVARHWVQIRSDLFTSLVAGHLTSKSDVYSFGVVLLEMLTGRRSMDKNRPNGEHNLVEWARPHLGERRRFYRLIDPRLEGHFSIKGAQKAAQLAHHCLSRDPKARPLMSEVVEALKPLMNLKDMASSSYYFQTMQAERAAANPNNLNVRNGLKPQASMTRNGQPMRSLSYGAHASPYHQSPKPNGRQP
ncbi:Serine/threonine-protein kinase pbl34 [Asimina triloba]